MTNLPSFQLLSFPRASCPPYSCSKRSGQQPTQQPLVAVETAGELQRIVAASVPSAVVVTPSLLSVVAMPRWIWQHRTGFHASRSVSDQSSPTMKCDVLSFCSDALVPKWLWFTHDSVHDLTKIREPGMWMSTFIISITASAPSQRNK